MGQGALSFSVSANDKAGDRVIAVYADWWKSYKIQPNIKGINPPKALNLYDHLPDQ